MLNPTLVIVVDSEGDLAPWYATADLWTLCVPDLPPRFVHVGQPIDAAGHDRLLVAPAPGGTLDKAALAAALTLSLRAISDAHATAEAMRAGRRVSERATILLVMRSGDPLCDSLATIVHELHRVIARLFPALNSHVALAVLLPSLFSRSSDAESSRTYTLLRWIDRTAGDSTAIRIYDAPRRAFHSVWLVNATNENGQTVGQFPAAFESLTAFLHALLLGAVALPDPDHYAHGKHGRAYATFGCSILTAERDALQDAVAATLYADLLPRMFGGSAGSPEVAARDAERFVSASELDRLPSMIASDRDGAPLYQFRHLTWGRDTAKQTSTVLADLAAYRQNLERMRHDVLPEMERRQEEVQRGLQESLKTHAAERADADGCHAVEWFLESLVADPPEDEDLLDDGNGLTFFGLLGRAIDRLDSLIGFAEPRERARRLEQRLETIEEQRRTLDAQATLHEERISSARLADPAADTQRATSELAACRAQIESLSAEIRAVRAQYRGQMIANRQFHMSQRQSAVSQRRATLAEQAARRVEIYTRSVATYRETSSWLAELYDRRRAWLIRVIVIVPLLTLVTIAVGHATRLATSSATTADLIRFYVDHFTAIARTTGVGVVTYAAVVALIYWRRFAVPIAATERELQRQDEAVTMEAEACAKAERDIAEFVFLVFQSDAAIRILMAVRAHGRDELLPRARAFRAWANAPIAWAPVSATLYRSPAWDAEQVARILSRALEDKADIDSVFRATTGPRSSWAFLDPAEARERLEAFAVLQFKRIGELTTEEVLFHPKFGVEPKRAENLLLSIDEAAAPYLRLHDAHETFSERIVLTAAGRHSRVRELLERHQVHATYPPFADDSRIVIILTRQGFPIHSTAELRSYWHDYLADMSRDHGSDAARLPDLLPLHDLGAYNDVARAFLTLWSAGRIARTDEGYELDGELLCADRLRFYADCVGDPAFRDVELRVIREAATVNADGGAGTIELPADAALLAWERDLISKTEQVEAI